MNYTELVKHILELDKFIACATIAKLQDGKILATKCKEDAQAFLTRQESELLTMQSLIRMSTRSTLEYKLGKALYSSTIYENVTRASMYLFNDRRRKDGGEDNDEPILMLTFHKNADHELIINSKVLPFLMEKAKAISQVH